MHTRTLAFIIRKENPGKYAQRVQRWHLVVVGLLGESMYDFSHPTELPLLHWFCCYWLYYLCYQRTGNQNCKNRSGEYRTLNLQWRNIQLAGNVNQTLNTGGGTTVFVKATYVGICACGGATYCWLGCG
jgi:hypothetical protein